MATIRQIMTLLGKANIKDDLRREMVYNFTNGRTNSIKELTKKELTLFCDELESKTDATEVELLMRRKRSVVLTIATRTGIKEANGWTSFNSWMKSSSILKKELHAYDFDELDHLIKQFRALESNFNKSASKTGTKAWHQATGIPTISQN